MKSPRAAAVFPIGFLLALLPTPVRATDVAYFGIIKSQEFVQTNAGPPVARATNGYAFNALVVASTNHVVTNATVKPSNATPLRTLVSTDSGQALWRFEERFNTQAALDATYPYGTLFSPVNYAVTMGTTHDGVRTVNLNYSLLSLVGGQPAVPQISNFNAAQDVDHTVSFTLQFGPSGNALVDLVQLVILDAGSNVVFASPAPFSPGALTGASTSVGIPGHTLPPGQSLTGYLAFLRPTFLETNAYPGAVGVPAVLRATEFPIATRPAPPPPVLTVLSSNTAPFVVGFAGETNRVYVLQCTTNFTDWVEVATNHSNTGIGSFTDDAAALLPARFYRVKVGQ